MEFVRWENIAIFGVFKIFVISIVSGNVRLVSVEGSDRFFLLRVSFLDSSHSLLLVRQPLNFLELLELRWSLILPAGLC